GGLEFAPSEVDLGQVEVSVVLPRLQGDRRAEVVLGALQLPLLEVEDAAGEQQDVPGVLVRLEPQRLLEVALGVRQRPQPLVGEAPEEVGPDEVGPPAEAGVQARLRRIPVPRFQVTDGEEELRPEMTGLPAEGAVEGARGLLPVAAPTQFFAGEEV